jgi:MFS family permease
MPRMMRRTSPGLLAPFAVRSFRCQWSADLAASCAFEMETIALGWFILVETGSVLWLTLFASLQYLGTLLAPLVGLVGDRMGHRRLLCAMRAIYLALATSLMGLAFMGWLGPVQAFAVAALAGLVRASDFGVRNVLIGETMPPERLLGALGLSRITSDSARGAGALAGAGMVAALGLGWAYAVVVLAYAASLVLSFRIGATLHPGAPGAAPVPDRGSAWRDMTAAFRIAWELPAQRAVMGLAFLINLATYPFILGLLPYVARNVYGVDQTGLGWMVATTAAGCVAASILLGWLGPRLPPARMMIVFAVLWQFLTIALGLTESLAVGLAVLALTGLTQGMSMVPMSVVQLRNAPAVLRGRIAGLRTLAVYGLPLGLWLSGPLIAAVGFTAATLIYGLVGLAATLAMLIAWRAHLWPADAPANR